MTNEPALMSLHTHRLRAVFMRGGTSKALIFRRQDLPAEERLWSDIFLQVMGSPDPYGRQLDGMGGGLSSLSKICIVGPPSRPDADVDYTFVQVAVEEPVVDFEGNCGNMSAAIGPYALEEGLLPAPPDGEAVVRLHNTNTGKIVLARFPVAGGLLPADGDLEIDGVAGTAAPVRLEFIEPGGAKTGRLLPTGSALDLIAVPGVGDIPVSCVDAANPCLFVAAEAVGKSGLEMPGELDRDRGFLELMERLRLAGAVKMGLARDLASAAQIPAIPKIAMVAAPGGFQTLAGRELSPDDMDICVRMISVGQPHRAIPVTGAVCLAVATRVPGTIANRVCLPGAGPTRIGHASGTLLVDAAVSVSGAGETRAEFGAVYRTCRRLFEGAVVYRAAH